MTFLSIRPDEPCFADCVGLAFAVFRFIGNATVVEIVEDLDLSVAAEKLLIGTKRFSRGAEAFFDTLSEIDLLLDLFVADQVYIDRVGLLADTVRLGLRAELFV